MVMTLLNIDNDIRNYSSFAQYTNTHTEKSHHEHTAVDWDDCYLPTNTSSF